MFKHIEEIEFTIFDTETTGLEPEFGDRIIEIAGIRFKGKEKLAFYHSLVNPQMAVKESALKINNITDEMLKDAPEMKEVLPKFLDFIKGSYLCAYNAGFDMSFLKKESELINLAYPKDLIVIDLLKMSKRLLPGLSNYALISVAKALDIKIDVLHRAFFDAQISFEIFQRLKEIILKKGISDFNNFFQLFSLKTDYLEDLKSKKLNKLQEAINLGLKIKIRYFSSKDAKITEREVIPNQIKQQNGRFYLVGFCLLREEERSFNIDGILHIEIL